MVNDRPNPDELLKAIQQEEKREKSGKLKIFFGMSAGVGKTYAMLQEAQELIKEGKNVAIGVVNTHGRPETEALLKGIPVIHEKWIPYKDTVFEEMDLEKILEVKPDLVLVDELAHTNVPGSKHLKRWQDVLEILDAGINVSTTLNVQHIETRSDLVESLTGIQIRETVPDSILERANTIEIVDISPEELLVRLKEGKVYLGDQSKVAQEHFFKEQNLTALREIALRLTAEKVDHDLHGFLEGKGWKTRERLMVAISPSPSSQQLIRAARRLAFELDAPWIAVYVDTGRILDDKDQARLINHLNLARDLGAEVFTIPDYDVASALLQIAKQKDITRLVIGRTPKKKWYIPPFFQESILDKLVNENKQMDIVVLRQEKILNIYQQSIFPLHTKSTLNDYLLSASSIFATTIVCFFLEPWIGYKAVGMIFLICIFCLSLFLRKGPILLAAILSYLSWDYFFIPPVFEFYVSDMEDFALIGVYFFVVLVMGLWTMRQQDKESFLERREEKIARLFEVQKEIAKSTDLNSLRKNVLSYLETIFPGKFDILVKDPAGELTLKSYLPFLNDEKEQAVAIWVFKNGKVGGMKTDTLPSAQAIYFPIKYAQEIVGVLVYQPLKERPLSVEESDFLSHVAQQLGIYLLQINTLQPAM